jgi:hypothetical protein
MEMASLWKPQNGSHRDLEISPRTRDSHIATARIPSSYSEEDKAVRSFVKRERTDHLLTTESWGHGVGST